MKASDLRIGNWLVGSYNGFSKNVAVYEFDHTHIRHTNEKCNILPIDCFYPIPLTPEILANCGFDYNHLVDAFVNKHHLISDDVDGWRIHLFCTNDADLHIKIEFLHQLQNLLYAIGGEELKFKP